MSLPSFIDTLIEIKRLLTPETKAWGIAEYANARHAAMKKIDEVKEELGKAPGENVFVWAVKHKVAVVREGGIVIARATTDRAVGSGFTEREALEDLRGKVE